MRISLNLSTTETSRDHYALAWAIPALLVGLIGLTLLGVYGRRQYRAYRADQLQVGEIQRREVELRGKEAGIRRDLEKPAYGDLLRQVRFVNTLIDEKQVSLTDLVGQLVVLMPNDAHLTALTLESQGQGLAVRFTVTGKSEEAVEAFLGELEDAPNFKDVTILNQGFQEEGAQPGQVSVACTARYLPGVR